METTLISISGRMGSGKDTVGSMFKYLLEDGIQHKSFANWLKHVPREGNWEIKKFAGKLKKIAAILTGVDIKKFEDFKFKQTLLGQEWAEEREDSKTYKETTSLIMMSVRTFLQRLGTEGLRDGLHKSVWVNALFADYTPQSKWIVTDCRFENELQAIKKHNGITIKLTRNNKNKSKHTSETALDNAEFDIIINNKRQSLKETYRNVKYIIERI